MIEFKNKAVKIIFYVVFSLLTLLSVFTVVMAFVNPPSSMGLLVSMLTLLLFLLLPSLLMILIFTNPTPHKKHAGKQTRTGKWIPISTFLVLSALATVLMTIQSGSHCRKVGREGDLWDCDFTGADLSHTDLQGSDMSRSNLSSADLSGSDLSRANLSRADLSNSILVGADLSDAVLFDATLDGADLSNAVLNGASLKWASLVGVTGLTDESLANLEQWEGMLLQSEEEMLVQLWKVCDGMGIESAAAYDPDQGASSIILITDEGEKHPTSEYVPGFWWPASVSNAELVACVAGPYRVAKGSCPFDDGTSFDRFSQRIDVSMYVARTGDLLEIITLEGPQPSLCPQKKVADSETRDDIGDAPYGVQIIEALTPFARDGGDLHPPRLP
ncbi:MAG: pentapeptide repeat-containing protein [Anaerolineales bacterium]|nr:MAG: pentapeptide repeat-containing protein [Anaerolineales bacterium]